MNTDAKSSLIDRLALALVALGVLLLFIQQPGLGDDFQYWWIGANIHLRGDLGWSAESFHYLRWPLWGACWALQWVFGPGLLSYYGVAYFYVTCGALLAYTFGGWIFRNRAGAWASALAYLLHPLMDDVIYRPMPDLAEGVLIGAAVFCWFALVEREGARARLPWALAAGFVCAILYANRLTGVFVFGVLAAVALVFCWKNPRFPLRQAALWLGVIMLTWLVFVSIEGLIYYRITGDFFHSITANLGARGRKGTESVVLWTMPFRFFHSLWSGGVLGPLFSVLSIVGGWQMWRTGGRRERAIVVWAVILYLAYNCALQSFFPPRPLLRNADRFLCSLSLPLSILCWAGMRWLWAHWGAGLAWTQRRPVVTACVAVILLAGVADRDFFSLGYLPELRAYMRTLPAGSRIFTHDTMRFVAMLADPEIAKHLQWSTQKVILETDPASEQMAAQADEFWYCRKHIWLSARRRMEAEEIAEPGRIASYFGEPHSAWRLQNVILHEQTPEFIFYRKRPTGELPSATFAIGDLIPGLPPFPLRWDHNKGKGSLHCRMNIPERLRGKPLRIEFDGKASLVQSATVKLDYYSGGKFIQSHLLKPYLHHERGVDFHALRIPANADTCEASVRIASKAKLIELDQIWLVLEP